MADCRSCEPSPLRKLLLKGQDDGEQSVDHHSDPDDPGSAEEDASAGHPLPSDLVRLGWSRSVHRHRDGDRGGHDDASHPPHRRWLARPPGEHLRREGIGVPRLVLSLARLVNKEGRADKNTGRPKRGAPNPFYFSCQ